MKLVVRIMIIGLMSSSLIVARELPGSGLASADNDDAITDNWEGIDPASVPGYVPPVLTPEQQLAQRLQRELAAMEDGSEKERMLAQLNQIPSGQLLLQLLARQSNGGISLRADRAGTMHGAAASGHHGNNPPASIAASRRIASHLRPSGADYLTGALLFFWSGLKDFANSLQEKDKED